MAHVLITLNWRKRRRRRRREGKLREGKKNDIHFKLCSSEPAAYNAIGLVATSVEIVYCKLPCSIL